MLRPIRATLALLALLSAAVSSSAAQGQEEPGPFAVRLSPGLVPAPIGMSALGQPPAQADCPQCTMDKKFWRGAWQLMVV